MSRKIDRDSFTRKAVTAVFLSFLFSNIAAQPVLEVVPEQEDIAMSTFDPPETEYIDQNYEIVYTRPVATCKFTDQLQPTPDDVCQRIEDPRSRPIVTVPDEFANVVIETLSHTAPSLAQGDIYYANEFVLLPYTRGDFRNRELIGVDSDMREYFFTFYSTTRDSGFNFGHIVYFETDDQGNTCIMLPVRNNQDQRLRIQLWVKPSEYFKNKVTKEHLFQKYGYYLYDSPNRLPEWQIKKYLQPLEATIKGEEIAVGNYGGNYILSVAWTPNNCILEVMNRIWMRRDRCTVEGKWAIHGLWSVEESEAQQKQELLRHYCKWRVYGNSGLPSLLQGMRQRDARELRQVWFSQRAQYLDIQFWEYEWCAHGRRMFHQSKLYFDTARELFASLNLHATLEGDVTTRADDRKIFSVDEFEAQIKRYDIATGKHQKRVVQIACRYVSSRYAIISEIRFCFNNKKQAINCQVSLTERCRYRPDTRTHVLGIFHSSRYQMFPYFVLTLVWPKSQIQRMSLNKEDVIFSKMWRDNRYFYDGWKIHKLCPSNRYAALIARYKGDRAIVGSGFRIRLESNSNYSQPIREHFRRQWPILTVGIPVEMFWNKVWQDCGMVAQSRGSLLFRDPFSYLDTTSRLYESLETENWGIKAKFYTVHEFHQRIDERSAHNGQHIPANSLILVCASYKGKVMLVKVRVCYTLELQFTSCPQSEVNLVPETQSSAGPYVSCKNGFNVPSYLE